MKILAIANRKGGVAKTTTTFNLGALLHRVFGRRVLLVDLDPQASLTSVCGVGEISEAGYAQQYGAGLFLEQIFSLAEVIGAARPGKVPLAEVLVRLDDGFSLCPADSALAKTETGLLSRVDGETALKKVLQQVQQDFDICLIDCPPGQGILTLNALTAAQAVIIPSQPTAQDLRALLLFTETIKQVKQEFNGDLDLLGVLLTFYDDRLKHHKQAVDLLKKMELPLFDATIGRSVRVAEASAAHQPLILFDPKNTQVQNFHHIAAKIHAWAG